MVASLSSCGFRSDDDSKAPGCAALVEQAAAAADISEQIRLLDRALITCRTYSAFDVQLDQHPAMIGFDNATFIANRCLNSTNASVRDAPACVDVVPVQTAPDIPVVVASYEGETLDGRTITITESDLIPFVDGRPEVVVAIVDIAAEDGCEGTIAERDLWASQIDDPTIGDAASVFARHAANVMLIYGCDPPDETTG